MAFTTLTLRLRTFFNWARSEFNPKRKLAWRLPGIKVHEDVADFVHGILIGLMLGFLVGLFLSNFFSSY